jgi:hypothetical protein
MCISAGDTYCFFVSVKYWIVKYTGSTGVTTFLKSEFFHEGPPSYSRPGLAKVGKMMQKHINQYVFVPLETLWNKKYVLFGRIQIFEVLIEKGKMHKDHAKIGRLELMPKSVLVCWKERSRIYVRKITGTKNCENRKIIIRKCVKNIYITC